MKKLIIMCAVGGLLLNACSETTTHEKSLEGQNVRSKQTPPLPAHSIISDVITHPVKTEPKKRSVDIRLESIIAKDDLERLAKTIRLQSPHQDRLFISYYLPSQTIGAGSWGATKFTPNLETTIHGMTQKQANDPFPSTPQNAVVLAKFVGNSFLGEKAVIYKAADGTIQNARKYKDGSGAIRQLFPTANGRLETRNGHGEYYIISGGSISSYDAEGLIDSYTALKLTK